MTHKALRYYGLLKGIRDERRQGKLLTDLSKVKSAIRCTRDKEEATQVYYEDGSEEKHMCSFFGCGRELSLREGLFGDRCVNHVRKKV